MLVMYLFLNALDGQILLVRNLMNLASPQVIYTSYLVIALIVSSLVIFIMSRAGPVYLVDYALFSPPRSLRCSSAKFVEHINLAHEPNSWSFQIKMLERSGIGEETCFPPALNFIPMSPTMKRSNDEAEQILFSCMDSLLKKTGLDPKDVDILIINNTCFCPVPSLTSMVINKYKMRSNIKSFNLSGMGCSAGLISISLAKEQLRAHRNINAVVIITEILTPNIYRGKERAMLLPNCLFRMGGAAVLLSNRRGDRNRAKYRLNHLVRTHMGADEKSYNCIFQEEDPEGIVGVKLSINLMAVAGEALKANIMTIAPLVLPVMQKLRYVSSLIHRKLFNSNSKPYVPDFKDAFEHFCIHAGGRAVIEELQKGLNLREENVEASKMTLHRFGNTSSSSLWYELSYIESKGRMKKGDRVWQIGVGAGFKCNSAAMTCNRNITTQVDDGPWADCIDKYLVTIPIDVNK